MDYQNKFRESKNKGSKVKAKVKIINRICYYYQGYSKNKDIFVNFFQSQPQ